MSKSYQNVLNTVIVHREKMHSYQNEELSKREKRLLYKLQHWKISLRDTTQEEQNDLIDENLAGITNILDKRNKELMDEYNDIQSCDTPSPEQRHKKHWCEATANDLMKFTYDPLAQGECRTKCERYRLNEQLRSNYAYSAASRRGASLSQAAGFTAAERVVQPDGLAQYMFMQERNQKETIEHDYVREVQQRRDEQVFFNSIHRSTTLPLPPFPIMSMPSPLDSCYFAQAIQKSIANRLPTSEPTVFSGNTIHFNEWKESFLSLINKEAISDAEKLCYLKKYVIGPAYACLEGPFNRNDGETYRDAWEKLNKLYGQPVVVPSEIREKSSIWPKSQSKDCMGRRNNKQTQINGILRPPQLCNLCKDNHQLHNCSEFMRWSLDDRRLYVKDFWLCYGCLKPGHSAKECHHRHTCDLCKGRHPTCLHDDNYRKDWARERSASETRPVTAYRIKRMGRSNVAYSPHRCLEGSFHQGDSEAYGQPFVERSFKERLSKWPKIKSEDIDGLRALADLLNARLEATPQGDGSEIWADYEETQILLQKIPKWLASRWNQRVSEALNRKDFTRFSDFAKFVSREAEMANNPVASIHAVHASDWSSDKRTIRGMKGKQATIYGAFSLTKGNSKQMQINGKLPRSSTLCNSNHHHQPHNFSSMKRSPDVRRLYIKD